jgi:hypothetical protein
LSQAVLLVFVLGGLWFGLAWSRRVTRVPLAGVSAPGMSGLPPDRLSALDAARVAATPRGARGGAMRAAALAQMSAAGSELRRRLRYLKWLGPEFRNDPVVQQLLDYEAAAQAFPSSIGENGVLPPERLADPRLFIGLGMPAPLPAAFASLDRDGYQFMFDGRDCSRPARILTQFGTLCSSYAYSARPRPGSRPTGTAARTYALLSGDDRIHYRTDGLQPTPDDPTVDNTAPSTAADLSAVGEAPPGSPADSRVAAALRSAMKAVYEAAGFANAEEATAAFHEQVALNDLRMAASAENVFVAMMERGFAPPAQMADHGAYRSMPRPVPPLLPGYFVQPQRLGYRFEFEGDDVLPAGNQRASFGPSYGSYRYSAVPLQPGPVGRRSFAIYENGQIYATKERRVASRSDPALGR